MTREEAIKEFEYGIISDEAVKMAIKALEQEPSEDCVSRQAVDQNIYDYAESNRLSYANMKNAILDVPPVTPAVCIAKVTFNKDDLQELVKEKIKEITVEQRWIPVKERLPETDGDYLLFGKIDDFDDEYYIFIGEFDSAAEKFGICRDCFDPNTLGCLGSDFYEYGEVLAWMPLPDDYKKGVEE